MLERPIRYPFGLGKWLKQLIHHLGRHADAVVGHTKLKRCPLSLTQNEEEALTICEVFVGDLEDPTFKWDDIHWNGNIPARLSPIFPPLPGNYNRTYDEWVVTARVKSKQTDFGGQVAQVTKSQIEQFVASAYRDDDRSRHSESFAELAQAIAALDDHRTYGLVATEW